MDIFKNILIPISSEFYSRKVVKRAVFLYEKLHCNITILFIVERKNLLQTDKFSDSFITSYSKNETSQDMLLKNRLKGNKVILDDVKKNFEKNFIIYDEKIVEDEFSIAVKNELEKYSYDLVLMGFEKDTVLNYRIIDELDVSLWVESISNSKLILAVCSNLAPNKKVPEFSIELSRIFGWDLFMLYVIDIEDSVIVDDNGVRSGFKPDKDLLESGRIFVEKMRKKGISIKIVKGGLERETIKAAERLNANLVILGREQKKRKILGLPAKNIKKKLTDKCRYSLLFTN